MCHKLCTESLECTWGKEKDNDIERNKEGRTWRLVRIPRELLIFLLLGPIVMFRLVNVWQELCFYLVLPLFHVLFWVLPVISKRTCRHRQRGTAKICDIYKIFFFVSKNVQEIYVRGAFSLLLPFFLVAVNVVRVDDVPLGEEPLTMDVPSTPRTPWQKIRIVVSFLCFFLSWPFHTTLISVFSLCFFRFLLRI